MSLKTQRLTATAEGIKAGTDFPELPTITERAYRAAALVSSGKFYSTFTFYDGSRLGLDHKNYEAAILTPAEPMPTGN